MPLVHWAHAMYWQQKAEPPPTPGLARRLPLLQVGHGFIAVFLFALTLALRGS